MSFDQHRQQQQPIEPFALRHKKDVVYVPHDASLDPPPRTCFKCHQPGHSLHTCKERLDHELCFNCGRRGVRMSNCPRCYVAWQKHHTRDKEQRTAPNDETSKDDCESTSSSVENVEVPPTQVEDKCSDNKDTVQEIKELLESIKHLSVETQDLVVKQVMLERREKLERRSKIEPSSSPSKEQKVAQANGAMKKTKSATSSKQHRSKQESKDRQKQPQRGFPRQDSSNHHHSRRQDSELAAMAERATNEFVEKRQMLRDQKSDVDDMDDW